MPFWKWSKTAAANASADPAINWAEGQAPSSINDSARAMMAEIAKYRDDVSGTLLTTGTSTAYAVSSNQVFDTLPHLDGAMIAFTPHVIGGAAPTLNVDGLGAKPLRFAPGVPMPTNSLLAGTPYVATYYDASGEFILNGAAFSNPYNIPLGAGVDYWLPTAPNSAFVFPYGQAISRATYATLFSGMGTTFGAGDGSTTFNLPDKRGRVTAAWDNMGGVGAGRLGVAFGGATGTQTNTITQNELPAVALSVGTSGSVVVTSNANYLYTPGGVIGVTGALNPGSTIYGGNPGAQSFLVTSSGTFTASGSTSNLGFGAAQNNLQPTIVCNYIMRIV